VQDVVWVVDDKAENRQSTLAQYGAKNEVTLFASYGEMLKALANPKSHLPTLLLTDLIMPAEEFTLSLEATQSHKGVEFPAGMFLAMLALIKGVPRISLQTDTNHHHHPASAALDFFQRGQPIQVGGATISFHSARIVEGVKDWVTPLEGERA
jgi:CheY-like chemotaxis protein